MRVTEVTIQRHDAKTHGTGRIKNARIYFWPKGETILENLRNRRTRPYTEYRKHLDEVLEKAGIEKAPWIKINWSRYAGCSCPCSPGFIMRGIYGKDIHVTVEE